MAEGLPERRAIDQRGLLQLARQPSKKEIITQTTMGTVITRWEMTIGSSVPVSSSHWNSRNSGMR